MGVKVLMFGWEFPPHNSGGLGTACFGLTKALAQKNTEIIFVLPKHFGKETEVDFLNLVCANIPDVDFRRLDGLLYPYVTEEAYQLARGLAGNLYGSTLLEEVRLYALRAKDLARDHNFDVIHAHDWLSFPAGIVAKEASGKPLVVHVHATEFDRTGGHNINPAVYAIEKEGMTKADRVIAVSQWTKNILVDKYGLDPAKVTVVHNGVDAEMGRPVSERLQQLKNAGNNIVLFVGRLTLQKGPDYFVRLAKRVLTLRPNTYFVIAGAGDMERQVIKMAAALGVADRVIFAGFLRGEELAAVYQAADLYVLPSVSEPFGITPLEALVNGAPVLISKQSGVSEVLTHVLKTDFWDIDEMANKVIAVLSYPPLKETLRALGRQEAEKVSWLDAAEKCLQVYKNLTVSPAYVRVS